MACFRHNILFLLAADADVEADDTVLVAGADHGNVPRKEVLPLNDLLRALRDIGAVGERDVVGELLLDGDLRTAGGGVGLGGQALRVDLDAADAKEFLHAAAE